MHHNLPEKQVIGNEQLITEELEKLNQEFLASILQLARLEI